jgi:hypothetical protein
VLGVILAGVMAIEGDGLVTDDPVRSVGRRQVDPVCVHVRLGARDEESSGLLQHVKRSKINVATIHDRR